MNTENELKQRLHELEMIAQVSTAVSSILDLDTLLQQVLVRTKDQFDLYHVNIALLDESGQNLVPVMADKDMLRIHSSSHVPPISLDAKPSIVARVARQKEPIVVNDVHTHPDFMPHPLLPDTQSEMTLPMIVGDEFIGILDVQATERDRFTDADLRMHSTLAAQIAIAIQNARAFQKSQQRQMELTVLNKMGRSLDSAEGIDALLTTFYQHASRLIDTTNFYIALYEPESEVIVFPMDVDNGKINRRYIRRQFGRGLTEYVIKSKQPLLIQANVAERLAELDIQISEVNSKSWLGVPMMVGELVTGAVAVQNYTQPYAFNEDSERLLVSLANQVALAIENTQLFSQVQKQAQSLEIEVAERTAELTEANKLLRWEVKEKKQAEEALQVYAAELERSNQELQNFAHVASHDLQEPLRKITAFSGRLQERYADVLDARGIDYLQRMESAAARMQNLILDLLAYSRVTTHSEPFADLSLVEIIEEVCNDLDLQIEEAKATVEVEFLPEIEADPTQMRQLFQNLISNSLKFVRPGVLPHLQISGQITQVDGREQALIQLKDNGIGIEAEYHQRIFEVFERLHTRSEYEGTGVGLAICRKIVERHHGNIRVESTPNEFSTFIIILPLRQMS